MSGTCPIWSTSVRELPNNIQLVYTIMNMCTDPRKPVEGGSSAAAGPIGQYGVPAAYERSFKWKVGHFRNLCAVSCVIILMHVLV